MLRQGGSSPKRQGALVGVVHGRPANVRTDRLAVGYIGRFLWVSTWQLVGAAGGGAVMAHGGLLSVRIVAPTYQCTEWITLLGR